MHLNFQDDLSQQRVSASQIPSLNDEQLMVNHQIDWVKLVDYVSKRGEVLLEPSQEQMVLTMEEDIDSEEVLDLSDALNFEEFEG